MEGKTISRISQLLLWFCIVGTALTIWEYRSEDLINCGTINTQTIGTFGDFIGGFFGTILSIVAAILIYATYKTQSKELLEAQRLNSSQQFENNFFQLLSIQERIRNGISINSAYNITWYTEFEAIPPSIVSGLGFFISSSKDYVRYYQLDEEWKLPRISSRRISDLAGGPSMCKTPKENPEQRIKDSYFDFYQVYEDEIGHYMRNLYHILKFIKTLDTHLLGFTEPEIQLRRKLYADMVQSQLSAPEMVLIFYNGICFPKMKELIIQFKLIDNLRPANLADPDHQSLYPFEFKSISF